MASGELRVGIALFATRYSLFASHLYPFAIAAIGAASNLLMSPIGQNLCAGGQSTSPLVPGSGYSASLRGRVLCPGRLLWEGSPGQRKAGATNRRSGRATRRVNR